MEELTMKEATRLEAISDANLRQALRIIDSAVKGRNDALWNVLCQRYAESAAKIEKTQIFMLRDLVQKIQDRCVNTLPSAKIYDRTIESFFWSSTRSAESDKGEGRLRRINEAIQTVRTDKSDTACVRHCLLLVFLHVTVETLRAVNRNRRDPKPFAKRDLAGMVSSDGDSQIVLDLVKAYRAGERLARLFGRSIGYVFCLDAGAASMIIHKMNQHAVNAFVQGHEDLGPRFVILDLTRLASSVLSKLAKYLGWEDWVFDLTTWRFHAKSLIPNGLVKTTRIPPARSLAGPATLYSGLDEIEVNLLEFYTCQLCPGRTTSRDNMYLNIIPVAAKSRGVLYALLTLSASYRKEYYSNQHEVIELRETEYKTQTMELLQRQLDRTSDTPSSLLIVLLLIHHCIVNEDGDHCWSVHSKAANDLVLRSRSPSPPSVFTAFQGVLARTACALTDDRLPLSHQYHWLGSWTESELGHIDGTTGISRAVLHTINLITESTGSDCFDWVQHLDSRLGAIRQTVPVGEDDGDQILMNTAECYRIAARVYLRCRLLGCTSAQSDVIRLRKELIPLLQGLPLEGSQYTAVYPLWSMFVTAVSANDNRERATIAKALSAMSLTNKGNVGPALTAIEGIWEWQDQVKFSDHVHMRGWWEDMIKNLSKTPTTNMLSLG